MIMAKEVTSRLLLGPIDLYTTSRGRGPAILFTHGFGQAHECWRAQEPLSACFELISWDLPGHGRSGPENPRTLGLEELAEGLQRVIASYGLAERGYIHVVWSLGGHVLGAHLLQEGEAALAGLRGVVLVGTHVNLYVMQLPEPWKSRVTEAGKVFASDLSIRMQGLLTFVRMLSASPLSDEEVTLGYNAGAILGGRLSPELQRPLWGDPASLLRGIPLLYILGKQDALIPSELLCSVIAARLPHAQVRIYPGTGHSPFLEAPDRFNEDVAAFAGSVIGNEEKGDAGPRAGQHKAGGMLPSRDGLRWPGNG